MKRAISTMLVFLLVLGTLIPVSASAVTPRIQVIMPSLSFSGTTAHCELEVSTDYTSNSIAATIKLWNGSTCIATWNRTGSGYLSFYETKTVTKGNTYELTADVTINGTAQPTVSISRTCE